MGHVPKMKDLIDAAVGVEERVRILEISRASRTLVPERWEPNRDELYAIAEFCLLIGEYNSPNMASTSLLDAYTGQAAQYLWAVAQIEQMLGNPLYAMEWTDFLRYMGGIPSVVAMDPCTYTNDAGIPGEMGYPQFTKGSEDMQPMYDRVMTFMGSKVNTTWTWFNAGVISSVYTPDMTPPLYMYTGGIHTQSGALRNSLSPEPIVGRNNQYGFSILRDCAGPNTPMYTDQPGQPVLYDSGPLPCPAGGSSVFNSGGIFRVALFDGGYQPILSAFPCPRTAFLAGGAVAYTGLDFQGLGPSGAKLDEMADGIAAGLGFFPQVSGFFARHMNAAMYKQWEKHHLNHQSLHLGPGWFGRLEVQINGQVAYLRGTVDAYLVTKTQLQQYTSVAAWPTSYDDAWPEDRGYLLPEFAQGPGRTGYFFGHRDDGTLVPMQLVSSLDGLRRIVIDNNWASQFMAAYGPTAYETFRLKLDGEIIAVEY